MKNNTITDKKYKNTSGLIDGNAVGIQITEKGIAIHEFSNSNNKDINFSTMSMNIYIENVVINNIKSDVNKICMYNLDNSNKPNIIGTSGEICIDELKDENDKFIQDDLINLLGLLYKIKKILILLEQKHYS